METDFLNFRDGEHFSSGLYQNDILDDSQSSLLDIVAEEYSRNDSIWEEDVEQEINGDVAVIPMCGRLDTFPKMSNSPPARDFHRIFSDWQEQIASIEVPSTEDLPVHQSLVADMLECFNASTEEINTNLIKTEPIFTIEASTYKGKSFDKPITKPKTPVSGGKNLELLKKVVNNDIKLEEDEEDRNLHIKTEVDIQNEEEKHVDEFENLDNFDLTQYINPEADLLCDSTFLNKGIKKENIDQKPIEKYDETKPTQQQTCNEIAIKIPKLEPKTDVESSEDEDCIDVVTVSEQMPVLEACDLTSLLEQFEASEAMNPKSKKSDNSDTQKQDKTKPIIKEIQKLPSPPSSELEQKSKNKPRIEKKCRQKLVIKTDKVPTKLLQKLKAQTPKKSISLIPAMPSKKPRPRNTSVDNNKQKTSKSNNITQENVLFEHDYCGNWSQTKKLSESNQNETKTDKKTKSNFDFNTISNEILTLGPKSEIITSVCTKTEGMKSFCSNTEPFSSKNIDSYTKNDDKIESVQVDAKIRKIQNLDLKKSRKVLDDTAIRIKYAINNLSQETILKNQPIVKNADGKLMISLLKTNNRLLTANNTKMGNTPNLITSDEKQKNLTCDKTQTSKKRKLNLEEYKKLRGDVKILQSCEHSRNNSPLSSGANSPNAQNEKEKLLEENYREIMNKMASEILKTNVKTKPLNLELKLEEFVPPDIKVENNDEKDKTYIVETVEPPPEKLNKSNEKFKIITIVSIGTNTDISYTINNKPEKIQPEVDKTKLTEIIKPILKTASSKINSNSLITNITETLLQKSPNIELIQTTNLLENSLKPTDTSNISLSSKFENLSVKLAQIVTKNGKLIPKNESVLKNDIFITKSNQSLLKSEKQVSIIKNENLLKSGQNSNKIIEIHNENVEIHGKIVNSNGKYVDGSENGKNIDNGDKIIELNHTDTVDNCDKSNKYRVKEEQEHGEDKTVIVVDKDTEKPIKKDVQTQTDDFVINTDCLSKDFRYRRTNSECSSSSGSSVNVKIKKNCRSNRNSSSNSVSSSLESRYSRSESRSKSRSISPSDCSVYSDLSDSSRSRSRSISPSRWHTNRNSRSRKRVYRAGIRYRSKSYRKGFKISRSYSRSRSRRRRERENAEERMREVEERRVIYVGKISDTTTKADLRRRFQSFGPITNVSVHFRDHGDNYGFVTFAYKIDAYEAVERGNDDPNLPKYDISFGGRRAFCKTQYSDLDNLEAEELNSTPIFRKEEDSFDILLREVQAKLLKRKF